MNLNNLRIDDKYTSYILSKTTLFKYINPNLITLCGIVFDYFVLISILNKSLPFIGLSLFIRYSCDCLDGAVARKYNKVSDLGGILDTIADNALIFIASYGLLNWYGFNNYYIPFILVLLNIYYLYYKGSIVHHYGIKKQEEGFQNFYRFWVNNNIILYIIIFIMFLIR